MQDTDFSAAKILIVDDQPANVRLLEFTLRRAGLEAVSSTMEPREVAALHREHRFQLILLDLQMPEMNGHEVLQELQEIRQTHPVKILVISADPRQAAAALTEGADGFLEKPFRLPDVVERVTLMLGGSPADE
jgi:CheY-like chemotaxis protein